MCNADQAGMSNARARCLWVLVKRLRMSIPGPWVAGILRLSTHEVSGVAPETLRHPSQDIREPSDEEPF